MEILNVVEIEEPWDCNLRREGAREPANYPHVFGGS